MTTCEKAWGRLVDATKRSYTEHQLLSQSFDDLRRIAPQFGITSPLELARIEVQMKIFQRSLLMGPNTKGGGSGGTESAAPESIEVTPVGSRNSSLHPSPSRPLPSSKGMSPSIQRQSVVGSRAKTPQRRATDVGTASTSRPQEGTNNNVSMMSSAGLGKTTQLVDFQVPAIPAKATMSHKVLLGKNIVGQSNPNYIVSLRDPRNCVTPSDRHCHPTDIKHGASLRCNITAVGLGDPSMGPVPYDSKHEDPRGKWVNNEGSHHEDQNRNTQRKVPPTRSRSLGTSDPNRMHNGTSSKDGGEGQTPTSPRIRRGRLHYNGIEQVALCDPNETRRMKSPSTNVRVFQPRDNLVGASCTPH